MTKTKSLATIGAFMWSAFLPLYVLPIFLGLFLCSSSSSKPFPILVLGIHSFVLDISTAPLQVRFYSEVLRLQLWDCVGVNTPKHYR